MKDITTIIQEHYGQESNREYKNALKQIEDYLHSDFDKAKSIVFDVLAIVATDKWSIKDTKEYLQSWIESH